MLKQLLSLFLGMTALSVPLAAQQTSPDTWGDQGNFTYFSIRLATKLGKLGNQRRR